MVENTPFNDEWNKLQKTFWDNVNSNFVNLTSTTPENQTSDKHNDKWNPQASLFDQWLSDVDKCWDDHAQVSSADVNSLYKKISSSSRFFFNFSESVSSLTQGETADVLIDKYAEEFTGTTSENVFTTSDINSFWTLPLENFQQHAAFFATQQKALGTLSTLFEDGMDNPEFSTAIKSYLLALQKYQLVFFNLFTAAAKQTVEILKSNLDKPATPKHIMSTWLEVLESNYTLLITQESYSQAYAGVVNSWMMMVSKSNKPFAEFIQASMSSAQTKSNTQS